MTLTILPQARSQNRTRTSQPVAGANRIWVALYKAIYPEQIQFSSTVGEGIDLQEQCSALIHVDLPWTPIPLHQRVGLFLISQHNADLLGKPVPSAMR
ncbi:hypothetical protein OKW27_006055 [Paraburkholderia sp. 35.1]